ncbi:tetratricopeptide (TPR) repeat protein [Clostridium acetobutylicum]|nr:tetratricopeptide (TPR) repeat protein [Clostridium acetobutylicum]
MIYFNKATDYYNKKDYKRALSMYKKALELKENESASLYNSAVCLIKLKEYEKAIPFIKSAINKKNR